MRERADWRAREWSLSYYVIGVDDECVIARWCVLFFSSRCLRLSARACSDVPSAAPGCVKSLVVRGRNSVVQ